MFSMEYLYQPHPLHYIRHSGADIGIHEERGILIHSFLRLGQFQAGHSQPGIQRELQLPFGSGVGRGHQIQLLNSHAFLKRLSHGVQGVLHGNGGFFLGLFGSGQAGGTHRMQRVAFAGVAIPAQDGGKELRHVSRRRDGRDVHAERGLKQLQHRLNRLGRGRSHKQASLFRIPYAISDGRHKFRPGG